MSGYLLDTNVLSELRKPRPDSNVLKFVAEQPLESLFVSVVTLAEIRYGIEITSDVTKRTDLADWLNRDVRPMFEGRVLAISEEILLKWSILVNSGRKIGHTYSQPDLIIAATALHYDLTLVSRNTHDYTLAQANLLNPWTPSA